MITAYTGQWPQASELEQHALKTARVLLPASDDCIYIGFPWASLTKINDAAALRELRPKNRPGQRAVTVCLSLSERVMNALIDTGITDVFVANKRETLESSESIRVHQLESSGALWLSEVLSLFIENTQYPEGLNFNQRLVADAQLASGNYQERLTYVAGLCQRPSTRLKKPFLPTRKRVFLFGDHSHRTPLSYSDSQYPLTEYIEPVCDLKQADIVLTGNRVDFIRNAEEIADWYRAKEGRQLYVISEEPYWDTMWDKEFTHAESVRNFAGKKIPFKRFNHVTSDIFKWQYLPYYITTDNTFFARYAALFARNAELTADDWLAHWQRCRYPSAFIAEKRDEERFNLSFPELDMHSDCVLRSQLASESLNQGGFVEGKGWFEDSVIRQELDDWHLDKITKLDMNARVVSAIENTHHVDYITEKLFDAYAVGGISVYSANPQTHSVWRLVERDSLINLYGLNFEQARDVAFNFSPDRAFAEAYVKTQKRMAEVFSQPWLLWYERKRMAGQLGRCL
ncbi:glycosyltransferase family 10 [Idiomarina sp.]|uniref:glycosyltransferase family 10 domain-containing protein n=1 Tax=Idiomarina sp. TaxID=1874361 RepID=UPI00263565D4|nr:glycosyltransferase family 10 [Idiomarina sp.]